MGERLICEGSLRVAMDGGGDRTLLVVTDDRSVRFWTDTSIVDGVFDGEIVQLSAVGGYCALEIFEGEARVEFGIPGHERKRCRFPATELADALAWVRSLETPV